MGRAGDVTPGDIGQPYAIDATGPVYDAARAAFRQAWGIDAVDMGMGGSIPFIAEFAAAFPQAKILVTGVEDPQTQAHSINESLHLGVLERAATAEALLLANLAAPVCSLSSTKSPNGAHNPHSRRTNPLDLQLAPQFRDVTSGLDVVLRDGDLALLVDDERRADDALHGFAVHRFFAERAPRGQDLAVGVGQQRERQLSASRNLASFSGLSGEMPTTSRPAPLSSARLSRKSQACLVQPGVDAAG